MGCKACHIDGCNAGSLCGAGVVPSPAPTVGAAITEDTIAGWASSLAATTSTELLDDCHKASPHVGPLVHALALGYAARIAVNGFQRLLIEDSNAAALEAFNRMLAKLFATADEQVDAQIKALRPDPVAGKVH